MAPPVLVAGTGALATLFAFRLAKAGAQVSMLGSWQAALDAINQRGVCLDDGQGRKDSALVGAINNPSQAVGTQLAIVLVKTWQTERTAKQLAMCLVDGGVALTLQNGLGNLEILASILGSERVAVGATTTGAALIEPGVVRYGGTGSIEVPRQQNLLPLVSLLREAGFSVNEHDQVESLLWGKLVVNSAINPLTALLGVRNGALLEDYISRDHLRRTARESADVAAAAGITLPFNDPVEAVEAVAQRTANNFSSMLQDLRRGAPTEVDAINGAVLRAARSRRIWAPQNELLFNLVQQQVQRRSAAPVEILSYRRSVG
jgi:2-dehydropantoate 2-reductase